jgi:hypothetical protein
MIERAITFGAAGDKVGILTLPAAMPADDRPALILWNVGVNHRVGPFRVYVDLARQAASHGFCCLRFDASGMGDSEIRREALSDTERENRDVIEALDVVTRRTGKTRFIVVGFCSSVDAAHRVSVLDERVVGVVHIEGYSYPTPGYKRRLPLRLLSMPRWRRFSARHWQRIARPLLGQVPKAGGPAVFKRDYPTWEQFRADVATLTSRNVALYLAYVGNDTTFNHPEQFFEMFGSPQLDRSRIDIAYYPIADHTFYDVQDRTVMLQGITEWMNRRFS